MDYTAILRQLMQQANVSTFKQLRQQTGLSRWHLQQIRQGKWKKMRLRVLQKLAQGLQIDLETLLVHLAGAPGPMPPAETAPSEAIAERLQRLEQEYERLQHQLAAQQVELLHTFQQDCLNTLETWLVQWPTAAFAAQHNAQLPAARLLPLTRPVEKLVASWGVQSMAPVGSVVPYDPHQHQLMEGTAQPGDAVKIRYPGYFHHDKLLHRAKVSPTTDPVSEP